MGPWDFLVIGSLLLIVGGIVFYVVWSKKRGKRCVGCPDAGSCQSKGGCSGNCSGCGGKCQTKNKE